MIKKEDFIYMFGSHLFFGKPVNSPYSSDERKIFIQTRSANSEDLTMEEILSRILEKICPDITFMEYRELTQLIETHDETVVAQYTENHEEHNEVVARIDFEKLYKKFRNLDANIEIEDHNRLTINIMEKFLSSVNSDLITFQDNIVTIDKTQMSEYKKSLVLQDDNCLANQFEKIAKENGCDRIPYGKLNYTFNTFLSKIFTNNPDISNKAEIEMSVNEFYVLFMQSSLMMYPVVTYSDNSLEHNGMKM